MVSARLFLRGDELDIGGEEAQERIVKAFQAMVDKIYVNLPMLRKVNYVEADVARAANPASSLFGGVGTKPRRGPSRTFSTSYKARRVRA